jgi:hypothetical protein
MKHSLTKQELEVAHKKADNDYLQEGLKRTYTERFLFTTMLYKVQKTMEKAKVVHKKLNK